MENVICYGIFDPIRGLYLKSSEDIGDGRRVNVWTNDAGEAFNSMIEREITDLLWLIGRHDCVVVTV